MKQRDDASIAPGTHLTEGELHTFLDGQVDVYGAERAGEIRAHLDACATCRDRLAVESAVHDRAAAILGSEVGSEMLGLASLAELQARAAHGTQASTARGSLERRVHWGWAATVVLSLGVGYGVGAWGPAAPPPAEEAPVATDLAESFAPAASPAARVEADQAAVAPAPGPESPGESSSIGETPSSVEAPSTVGSLSIGEAPSSGEARVGGDSGAAVDSRPALDPRRTVEEVVPSVERVAPIQVPEAPSAKIAAGSATPVGDPLIALQSAPTPPALRDVADRVTAGSAVRLSAEAARSTRVLRSDAANTSLGSGLPAVSPAISSPVPSAVAPEPQAPEPSAAESADFDDFAADVSLVLEGLTIDALRWMEVWPGQEGLVSIQRFADGRRVELRIAGPAVGDTGSVIAPPANLSDPIDGWARAVRALGSGWIALDGPLPAEELAALLTTIR